MPAAHGAVRSCARAAVGASLAGLGLLGYAFLEASLPVLRRVDVPVLAAGEPPVTLLHLSDLHLTDRTEARVAWVRRLARLRPDVVIDTGDNLSFANGLEPLGRALAPFLGLPGAFVLGDHDYRTTVFKSPTRYLRSHLDGGARPAGLGRLGGPDQRSWNYLRRRTEHRAGRRG